MRRRSGAWLFGILLSLLALAGFAAPGAQAHPLGNATVNHYDGLHFYPNRVLDSAVEDIAEIPTLQRKSLIDTDHDGQLSEAEEATYAAHECAAMAGSTSIAVNGTPVSLTVARSSYSEHPGVIQLTVGRLECDLEGSAELAGQSNVAVRSDWDSAGIGWHEITAVGTGVQLKNSPFPAASVSDELRAYPNDMLSSPLNVRSGSVSTVGGSGNSTYAAAKDLPVAGFAVRQLNRLSNEFNRLVGSKHLTVGVGVLAIVLAMLLGAGHAFLPGHGKTIMAAYLVGKRGRLRDVVLVGATVTITHTVGVLVLGIIISVTAAFSTTAAEQDLGIVSGLIIAGVGLGLLVSALLRSRKHTVSSALAEIEGLPTPAVDELALVGAAESIAHDVHGHEAPAEQSHSHDHDHPHSHDHGQAHDHPHEHVHDHAHAPVPHKHGFLSRPHSHGPGSAPHAHGPGFSKGGLVGLGVAGGLVPSPSALLVLLAAIALGRTAFGVTLVLSYGLGMAGALTAAGLILVKLRHQLTRLTSGRRLKFASRVALAMPILTAVLVLIVGVGLTLRAANGVI